jgi:hypothetical protein
VYIRLIEAGRAKDLRRIECLAQKNQETNQIRMSKTPNARQNPESFDPAHLYNKSKAFIQEKEKKIL